MCLLVARSGGANARFSSVFERRSEPHQRKLRNSEKLGEEIAAKLLAETYAETVVLDWSTKDDKGAITPHVIYDGEGNEMLFTFDNVVKLFIDLPDFFAMVRSDAGNYANFRRASQEADAKN